MPNFSPIDPLISFGQPKLLPMVVVITKVHLLPHPHVVSSAHLGIWKPHTKFQSDWWSGVAVRTAHATKSSSHVQVDRVTSLALTREHYWSITVISSFFIEANSYIHSLSQRRSWGSVNHRK